MNPSLSTVSGWGARDLITDLRNGRPPLWNRNPRGWVIGPWRTSDLIAFAESRGFLVVLDEWAEVR
ncbi:hypothetical protein [Nocardioides sp.]|uniref:hypothetical protein n=1 Tax=Nocardioides sp. TaxID=35761 RepID=UPI0035163F41